MAAEHLLVEIDRAVETGDAQHDMVEAEYPQRRIDRFGAANGLHIIGHGALLSQIVAAIMSPLAGAVTAAAQTAATAALSAPALPAARRRSGCRYGPHPFRQ